MTKQEMLELAERETKAIANTLHSLYVEHNVDVTHEEQAVFGVLRSIRTQLKQSSP